jgi:hypothetical protein
VLFPHSINKLLRLGRCHLPEGGNERVSIGQNGTSHDAVSKKSKRGRCAAHEWLDKQVNSLNGTVPRGACQ